MIKNDWNVKASFDISNKCYDVKTTKMWCSDEIDRLNIKIIYGEENYSDINWVRETFYSSIHI